MFFLNFDLAKGGGGASVPLAPLVAPLFAAVIPANNLIKNISYFLN